MCFCGMLNYYVYNAGLISFLMVNNINHPIQTIEDLIDDPEYKLVLERSTSEEMYFKSSSSIRYRNLWEKSRKEGGIVPFFDCMNQIKQDHRTVAFLTSPLFEGMVDTYPCQIVSSKVQYHQTNGAYIFRKDSEYIELFDHMIGEILGSRMDSMDIYVSKLKQECTDSAKNHFMPMSYYEVISGFVIFMLGCLLAIGYLMMEMTFLFKKKKSLAQIALEQIPMSKIKINKNKPNQDEQEEEKNEKE